MIFIYLTHFIPCHHPHPLPLPPCVTAEHWYYSCVGPQHDTILCHLSSMWLKYITDSWLLKCNGTLFSFIHLLLSFWIPSSLHHSVLTGCYLKHCESQHFLSPLCQDEGGCSFQFTPRRLILLKDKTMWIIVTWIII